MYLKKSDLLKYRAAFLAQMVERWPFKPMAVGSIPTEGVFFSTQFFLGKVPQKNGYRAPNEILAIII